MNSISGFKRTQLKQLDTLELKFLESASDDMCWHLLPPHLDKSAWQLHGRISTKVVDDKSKFKSYNQIGSICRKKDAKHGREKNQT